MEHASRFRLRRLAKPCAAMASLLRGEALLSGGGRKWRQISHSLRAILLSRLGARSASLSVRLSPPPSLFLPPLSLCPCMCLRQSVSVCVCVCVCVCVAMLLHMCLPKKGLTAMSHVPAG